MDVRYFLSRRIGFIRQFYATASEPYIDRKRKIEAEEEPFVPPYSEDGDPPFLEEWIEADESLHLLAYSCISMLATALHLYLETWVKQSGIAVAESLKKSVFNKHGWFAGYKTHFAQYFDVAFDAAPTNLKMLEEVVLARNRIQHPSSITSNRTEYANSDLKKLRHPFFVDERESALLADADEEREPWIIPPTLHITEAQLVVAVSEVERFAEWFETAIRA
ncbi:MAG: hypothetical protein KGS09_13470, partial [Nitrospirae bacterium]|nr:hypothetical protein [Nitrospirota bacterium]